MLTGTTAARARVLHDRVVDRIARAGGEGVLVEADEIGLGAAPPASAALQAASMSGRSRSSSDEVQRGREQEDAAVPEIFAGRDIALGGLRVGLLDKAGDREGALARRRAAGRPAM